MKTQIITLLCCCFTILGFSQSITDIEYFYNTDPGFGNATQITANANTGELTQTLSLPVPAGLSDFNTLYIRTQDDNAVWSLYDKRIFFITEEITGGATNIVAAEYFINTDPGFGNADPITINANTGEVSQTLSLPINDTNLIGFNTLYIRTQDDNAVWSLYDKRIFFITEEITGGATNIVAAEYFINTDPGFGNADPITINANTGNVTQTLSLPINDTNLVGFNSLYIRTQDDNGIWSLYDKRIFFITEDITGGATNIVAAEYFINTDPGFGNADPITINANTGEVSQTLSLPINDTNLIGFNTLYIRTQDDNDVWSLYDKKLFYISEEQIISPIVAAEYFYDVDPGFGNGTAATITPTGNPDEFTIDLSTNDVLPCDLHDFYIRLQNQNGTWSLYDYAVDLDVFDNADPTIVVFPNITAVLDANGQVSITIADVNNGTFDDCELVSVVLNQTQFDYTCANLGANTVTVTATDAEAKVSTLDVTITVVDNINPVAIAQNITVQLDVNGNATFTADDVDNNSTDNCAITTKALDITSFTCVNLGANTVILTVTDQSGNANNTTATVTVEDNINPVAITQNITVQLDVNGNATFTADEVDNNSTDNCAITTKALDITSFTCANLGANTVILTVTDQSGNANNTTATVTVEDNINPTVITQNFVVQLNASGTASITVNDIENGSTDNCTIDSSSLNLTSFDCSNLGSNTVTLSVTDQSGNIGTATATVTIEDNSNPVAITQNITVQLDVNGNATFTADDVDNNSTDNCAITTKALDITSFTCANLGANTVTLTVTDQSGNANNTTATVTVEDNLNPVAIGQDITIDLNGNASVSIIADDVNNGSNDNCGTITLTIDVDTFTAIGNFPVVLTATDSFGNTHSVTVIVTVDDTLGINDEEIVVNHIKLYPNPTKQYINISTNLIIDTLEIFDINGKRIHFIKNPSAKIDVSNFEAGVYFMKFYGNNATTTKRFIKQ